MPDTEYHGPDRRAPVEQWHIKKEIQIGHLVTTIVVAASAFWYVGQLEKRIAIVETQIASQRERDAEQDAHMAEQASQIRDQLKNIDSKLDRLIERQAK